jgi:hypothetical protein
MSGLIMLFGLSRAILLHVYESEKREKLYFVIRVVDVRRIVLR